MMAQACEGQLLQVVGAFDAVGGLAELLHGWEEQRDQHGDNRNDHQQLENSESAAGNAFRTDHGSCLRHVKSIQSTENRVSSAGLQPILTTPGPNTNDRRTEPPS